MIHTIHRYRHTNTYTLKHRDTQTDETSITMLQNAHSPNFVLSFPNVAISLGMETHRYNNNNKNNNNPMSPNFAEEKDGVRAS